MDQVIFKYPGQIFVGLATRKPDRSLNHQGFILCDVVPRKGATLFDRQVVEVLTNETLLKELSQRACVDKMEAVAVLKTKT